MPQVSGFPKMGKTALSWHHALEPYPIESPLKALINDLTITP
jgi:hypothetical protein